MTERHSEIDNFTGYPWSLRGVRNRFFDYDFAHLSGKDGGNIALSWEKTRRVFLRERQTPPKFISYYTMDTPYEEMAGELSDSLDKLDLPYEFEGLATRGSWVANTCLKSECVSRFWHAADGPICWLDADSTVASAPWFLSDNPFDFAIVKRYGWRFMSGVIYLNKTEAAKDLLSEWTALCKRYPYVWDQALLSFAWYTVSRRRKVNSLWLPVDIFDIPPQGNASSLKARVRWFWREGRYKFHRRPLPKFFLQKQASRSQKSSANEDNKQYEISSDRIAQDFRDALLAGDLSRDFSIGEVFPMIEDHEASIRAT